MSTTSLRVQYRPVRFGWCVETNSWSQFDAAIRWTHTLAGGHRNPVLPVDNPKLADALIDSFNVDVLFPVEETPAIRAFIKNHNHLPWSMGIGGESLYYEQWGERGPRPTFIDVTHAAWAIRERHSDRSAELPFALTSFSCANEDPLARIVLLTIGDYPEPANGAPDYHASLMAIVGSKRIELKPSEPLPQFYLPSEEGALTPRALCAHDLRSMGDPTSDGMFFGSAGSWVDLSTFWNLNAAGMSLCFVDLAHLQRFTKVAERHLEFLAAQPKRLWDHSGRMTDIWLTGKKIIELPPELKIEQPGFHTDAADDVVWNGLNTNPGFVYWQEKSVLGSIEDSDSRPSVTFQLPDKPFDDETFHQQLVATVQGADWLSRHENMTILPPAVPELNEYYGRELHFNYAVARSANGLTGGAISIIIGAHETSLTLRALTASSLIGRLLKAFGIEAKVSEPGLITARLIDQMGGLQGCRVFKIEGVRNLIRSKGPNEHFDRTYANKVIGQFDETTGRMRFEPFEALFLGPRRSAKLQPQDALNELLEKGVFRVGLELRCPHCQLRFWQHIDDVATRSDCAYCGTDFDVTLQLKDRHWVFRRSGLFGRDDDQHGGIPVALTLQQLNTALRMDRMLYTTSLELSSAGASISQCETDFAVLTSGRSRNSRRRMPQLLIGECKSVGGTISESDAQNLGRVADAFPANRASVFIVFAKTGQFSEEEIQACALAQGKWTSRVILLSKDELEPYELFERSATKPRPLGLEEIAEHFSALHAVLRPKGPMEFEEQMRRRRDAARNGPS